MITSKCSEYSYLVHIFNIRICRAPALKLYLHVAHWIPLGINPYANLTTVFFTRLDKDAEDEDVMESLELYVYAH